MEQAVPISTEPPRRSTRELVAVRFFYFFTYAGLGALFPFLPLLLETRGLGPASISLVLVMVPVTNLLAPPLWGLAADAFHARVRLLRIACVGCALSCLALIPATGVGACVAAVTVFSLFRAPLASLADSIAWVPAKTGSGVFSLVRVWGSVGFAVGALLVGHLKASSSPALLVGVTSGAYLLAAASTLPLRPQGIRLRLPVVRHTAAILARPTVLAFLAAGAAYYVAHGAYDAFFSLHLRRIGFDDDFISTAWAAGVLFEIGVMLGAPAFFRRWPSKWILVGCSAVAVARWLLLSRVHGGLPIIASQSLHGITFGLWYLALVEHVQRRAPEHLRTSLQSVTAAALALGMVGGYLLGGATVTAAGASHMFVAGAAASATALLLYLVPALREPS